MLTTIDYYGIDWNNLMDDLDNIDPSARVPTARIMKEKEGNNNKMSVKEEILGMAWCRFYFSEGDRGHICNICSK